MKRILTAFMLLLAINAVYAQKKRIDSLSARLANEPDAAKVKTLIRMANLYQEQNNNEKALSNYLKALQLAEAMNDKPSLFSSLYNLAHFYENLDKPAQALVFGLRAQKIAEQQGDKQNLYDVLSLVGEQIYFNDEKYEKALGYAQRMEVIANQIGDKMQIAQLKLGFGDLYTALKRYKMAFEADSAALIIAKQINNNGLIIDCLHNIGLSYELQKQYDKALSYYLAVYAKAVKGNIHIGFYEGEVAKIYLYLKRYNEALAFAKKSLDECQRNGDTHNELETLYTLREIYVAQKNYKEAYDSSSKYTTLQKSINSVQLQNKLSSLQSAYETEKQAKAIEYVQKETNLQKKLKDVLIGASVLLLAIVFLIAHKYRREKLAEAVLSSKNNQLSNTISELKSTQNQLVHAEKMASLGELTAGIAHEIQNPLNFVNNFSEVNREMLEELKAESKKPKGERDEQLEIGLINDLIGNEEKINHHGKRADSIVKGMLEHSRASTGQKEPTDINKLADEYLRISYNSLRAKDKNFDAEMITHFDGNLPQISVIPQDIGRVMLNLFNNAFYAVTQKAKTAGPDYKPEVSITTELFTPPLGGRGVVVKVLDNGVGIPDAIKEKIMQPFFTTKPTGEGTGLGLSLTYDMVVKGHGGNIQVESVEGEGSAFIITLPIS